MGLEKTVDLGSGFRKYFEVVPATTEALKDEAFRVRHRVYCEELKFEPPRPNGRETDPYDAHSLHCLIRSVHDGNFVGCSRLIRARPGSPLHPLPFETACAQTLDRSVVDPSRLDRSSIGEISRLAVVAQYRRRKGEERTVSGLSEHSFDESRSPRFPYIPVGLYLGTIELALRNGIDTIFVLTEPRLANHFSRLGVKVTQIGAPVEHRGTRLPSMMDCKDIVQGLSFMARRLYAAIAADVDEQLRLQQPPRTG